MGCSHNKDCQHLAGRNKCRKDVEGGVCIPSIEVRIELRLTLSNVEYAVLEKTLKTHGGKMPVAGFLKTKKK